MDFKLSLTTWGTGRRACPPTHRHVVALIAGMEERKFPVQSLLGEPGIAIHQAGAMPLLGGRPPQVQARERALHSMNDRQWAAIIAHKLRRVDDHAKVISLRGRHLSTSP